MKSLRELHQMAEEAGVLKTGALPVQGFFSEPRLIRAIQKAQGKEDCFRTEKRFFCKEQDCEWREECLKLVAHWRN